MILLCRFVTIVVSSHLLAALLIARQPIKITATWAELPVLIEGKRVTIQIQGGAQEGTVESITDTGIIVNTRTGQNSIPRASVLGVSFTRYVGNGRNVGERVGLDAGVAVGTMEYLYILATNAKAPHAKAIGAFAGSIVGGALTGHLLGRRIDRQRVTVTLKP